MPNYIVLRLTPPTAVSAADFTTDLTNLTVNFFDVSFGQPINGVPLGSAAFVPPPFPAVPGPGVVQHEELGVFKSVATAVILYTAPDPEYVTPDLRVEFSWGGAQSVVVSQI